MQICNVHVLRNEKEVAAHVPFRISRVDSGCGMQGLVKISHIVYKKAKSERLLLICPVDSARYVTVNEVVLEIPLLLKPITDVLNSFDNVFRFILELWVVIQASTLVKVWGVNEVPVVLPLLAGLLDLISESSAFNERIIELRSDRTLVRVRVDPQEVICLRENISSLSRELELLISYSGHEDVAKLPEGTDRAHSHGCEGKQGAKRCSCHLEFLLLI